MKHKTFCAHRGFNKVAPENTLPAFDFAVALGAKEIEFDLWPTADGKLVVCHDPTLERTTTGNGTIVEKTCAEILACDAGVSFSQYYKGAKVPLFEDMLEKYANKVVFNIHIKSLAQHNKKVFSDAVKARIQILYNHYKSDTPFDLPLKQQQAEVLPELEGLNGIAYNEEVFKTIVKLIEKYNCKNSVYITGEQDVLETAIKLAPDIDRCCLEGHVNYSIVEHAIKYRCKRAQFCKIALTDEMIKKAHDNNIICNLFWSNNSEEAKAYFDKGIDVILTDSFYNVDTHFNCR